MLGFICSWNAQSSRKAQPEWTTSKVMSGNAAAAAETSSGRSCWCGPGAVGNALCTAMCLTPRFRACSKNGKIFSSANEYPRAAPLWSVRPLTG